MKKYKKPIRTSYYGMATTTSWDWGFKPVPNKGGKTTNAMIPDKGGNKNA